LNKNNFLAKVQKKFETLKQFESKLNFKNQIRQPKKSDLELIAIDLTAEYVNIDSDSRALSQKILSFKR